MFKFFCFTFFGALVIATYSMDFFSMEFFDYKPRTIINDATIYANTDELLSIVHQSHKEIFKINGQQYPYELIADKEIKKLFWNGILYGLFEISGVRVKTVDEQEKVTEYETECELCKHTITIPKELSK